jgi:hypothetical protein
MALPPTPSLRPTCSYDTRFAAIFVHKFMFDRSRDAVERVGQQEGLLGVAAGKV